MLGALTGGSYATLAGVAFELYANDLEHWVPYPLAALAITSLLAWRATYSRYREARDTPTSNAASAAPGYVQLFGRAGTTAVLMALQLT